ncbi:MAG TPA: hypothetical protein VKP78_06640 [bacterium]|nr:hypothetical protein [bacterium]
MTLFWDNWTKSVAAHKIFELFFYNIEKIERINSIQSKIAKILKFYILILVTLIIHQCAMTNPAFTGNTLDKGDAILTPCIDYIMFGDEEEIDFGFYPSLGAAYGLPWRFEAGLQYYPTRALRSSLRWQITPEKIKKFKLGLSVDNFSMITHKDGLIPSYYSVYGLTGSYQYKQILPFVNLSYNNWLENVMLDERFLSGGIGVGFQLFDKKDPLIFIPEVIFGWTEEEWNVTFGVGFRVPFDLK